MKMIRSHGLRVAADDTLRDLRTGTKKQDRGRVAGSRAGQKRAIGRHTELMGGCLDFPEDLAAPGIEFEDERVLSKRHIPGLRAHVQIAARAMGNAEQLAAEFLFA